MKTTLNKNGLKPLTVYLFIKGPKTTKIAVTDKVTVSYFYGGKFCFSKTWGLSSLETLVKYHNDNGFVDKA